MIVKSIKLKNFRNHHYLTYEFGEKLNVITGDNAVGKTNVVEAINYLSLARSFRGVSEKECIQKGQQEAEVQAVIKEGSISRDIAIRMDETKKKVYLNGKPLSKLSSLSKIVNILLFEPKDVLLFKGAPKDRRLYLDVNLSKISPAYLELITKYDKVLKERNELLKKEKVDLVLLDALTEMLVKLSEPIISYRELFFKDINDILIKLTHALTGTRENLRIDYHPFIALNESFIENANKAFKRSLENDLKYKATSIGIQREDFSICLNNKDIGLYGSQGENRITALALKLSPYFLIKDEDKKPIIILDDVMSELDDKNKKRLIEFINKLGQVFITGTKLEITGANHYHIKQKTQKEAF